MNSLIVSGGNIDITFFKEHINNNIYNNIIAVDKGLETLNKLNIIPNYIVGDLDSVDRNILKLYSNSNITFHKYQPEKDYTDTDIALKLAIELGSTHITIIGGTGTRIDHLLANIHILCFALDKYVMCQIIDTNNKIYLINSQIKLEKNKVFGKYISLIPLTSEITGLTLTGFKYSLHNYTLTIGKSLGISNEIIEDVANINLESGILIVIESKD